jgi:rare lipoprotein A
MRPCQPCDNKKGQDLVTTRSTTLTTSAAALLASLGLAGCGDGGGLVASAEAASRRDNQQQTQAQAEAQPEPQQRRTRSQQGRASYYADRFHGRKMANGERFDRNSNSAAHRSLPLGTVARVTNLENGRSTVVEIDDRGPYIRGRIIDLSPRTAERLAMKHQGTAPVAVTPLSIPDSNGNSVPLGPTREASRE